LAAWLPEAPLGVAPVQLSVFSRTGIAVAKSTVSVAPGASVPRLFHVWRV
jgi:hypothetical protein